MPKLLYKLASRSRREKCFNAIDNIINQATIEDFLILCSFDVDDKEMLGPEVLDRVASYGDKVKAFWGVSGSKTKAINRDLEFVSDFEILLNHSDDFWIERQGFDAAVIKAMEEHASDTDIMLHFPDGIVNERLCTYQIVGKKYFDRTGYIYNPEYHSVFCDNEETEKAKLLGKYVYINENYLCHRHPIWGFGPVDELLRHTESFYPVDVQTYARRKSINFGINIAK